jgi:Glycosyltransferase family 87
MRSKIFEYKYYLLFAFLFFGLILLLENINGRFEMNDFKVYYLAAEYFLEGKNVYTATLGLDTGHYKYSPFILILFTPYCLFNFTLASIIHYAMISISAIATIFTIHLILHKYIFHFESTKKNLILALSLLCILRQIFSELHLGNVNMILLFVLSLAILLTLKRKYFLSGALIAIAILVKPYFIILGLPLLLYGQFKTIISIGASLLVSLLIVVMVVGIDKTIALHQEWIASIVMHNDTLYSHETIASMIRYYIDPSFSNSKQYYILAIVLVLYTLFFLVKKRQLAMSRASNSNEQADFIVAYFTLIAILPNLLITDSEHFMFSLPIISIILIRLFHKWQFVYTVLFIILIAFFTGNSVDIVGRSFSSVLDNMCTLGISNLGLIVFSLYVFYKRQELVAKK